jgi:hypothetical protein
LAGNFKVGFEDQYENMVAHLEGDKTRGVTFEFDRDITDEDKYNDKIKIEPQTINVPNVVNIVVKPDKSGDIDIDDGVKIRWDIRISEDVLPSLSELPILNIDAYDFDVLEIREIPSKGNLHICRDKCQGITVFDFNTDPNAVVRGQEETPEKPYIPEVRVQIKNSDIEGRLRNAYGNFRFKLRDITISGKQRGNYIWYTDSENVIRSWDNPLSVGLWFDLDKDNSLPKDSYWGYKMYKFKDKVDGVVEASSISREMHSIAIYSTSFYTNRQSTTAGTWESDIEVVREVPYGGKIGSLNIYTICVNWG